MKTQLHPAGQTSIQALPQPRANCSRSEAAGRHPNPDAEAFVRWGRLAARAGDHRAARWLFVEALDLDPSLADAWLWRGTIARRPSEAIYCLQQVLELEPDNPHAQRALEAFHRRWGRGLGPLADPAPTVASRPAPAAPGERARRVRLSLSLAMLLSALLVLPAGAPAPSSPSIDAVLATLAVSPPPTWSERAGESLAQIAAESGSAVERQIGGLELGVTLEASRLLEASGEDARDVATVDSATVAESAPAPTEPPVDASESVLAVAPVVTSAPRQTERATRHPAVSPPEPVAIAAVPPPPSAIVLEREQAPEVELSARLTSDAKAGHSPTQVAQPQVTPPGPEVARPSDPTRDGEQQAQASTDDARWVAVHRQTGLWSGATGNARLFRIVQPGDHFKLTGRSAGGRLYVWDPATRNYAYITAADVGPAPEPVAGEQGSGGAWVAVHRETVLWSGPTDGAQSFKMLGPGEHLQVARSQDGSRLYVWDPEAQNYAYVNAADVGPAPRPVHPPARATVPEPPQADRAPVINRIWAGTARVSMYTCVELGGCNRTASGIWPYEGVVAVDRRLIPLGSKVWIDGLGTFLAADTGSAIYGNRIDVFVHSYPRAIQWGVRYLDAVAYRD